MCFVFVFPLAPDGSRLMTNAPVARCINEVLPEEVFGVIFEEHSKLEWRAPVIDAQVCHQWRQTILHSPRVWTYLEFPRSCKPTPLNLHQWLDRSGSVPFHIQLMDWIRGAEEVLDPHCKRIKSIESSGSSLSFLENRSFPILRSLTIKAGYNNPPVIDWSACCVMPELRSFRAIDISAYALPSNTNIFPALRVLALHRTGSCYSIIRNTSHSLTSLMLDFISFKSTSGSLEFPSLRFLSLFEVTNIKHQMNVPALTVYHESGRPEEESFSMSLPSLIEYGIRRVKEEPFLDATKLHECYPNISRLSVRAHPSDVKLFLHSLGRQPTALPMLRILAVASQCSWMDDFSEEDKHSMRNDVFMRNMAGSNMELSFDGRVRIPIYIAYVRVYINEGERKLTSPLRSQIIPLDDLLFVLSLWLPC